MVSLFVALFGVRRVVFVVYPLLLISASVELAVVCCVVCVVCCLSCLVFAVCNYLYVCLLRIVARCSLRVASCLSAFCLFVVCCVLLVVCCLVSRV